MGSRASVVVIDGGKIHTYYDEWAAQDLDALMFWGIDTTLEELSVWDVETWDIRDWNGDGLLSNVWAEGGCCIDLDKRHLLIYGGDPCGCDMPYIETYLKLMRYSWPGWTVEWSWGEMTQIAAYAGATGEALEEIDCKDAYILSTVSLDPHVEQYFVEPDSLDMAFSTLSVMKDGKLLAGFTDETNPENLLWLDTGIEDVIGCLKAERLLYDRDRFLWGGVHLDCDAHGIWLWRSCDSHVDIELPDRWKGWMLHDCKHDFRRFYESIPSFVEFVPRTEMHYIKNVRERFCGNRIRHAWMKESEREALFDEILERYLEENSGKTLFPGI